MLSLLVSKQLEKLVVNIQERSSDGIFDAGVYSFESYEVNGNIASFYGNKSEGQKPFLIVRFDLLKAEF